MSLQLAPTLTRVRLFAIQRAVRFVFTAQGEGWGGIRPGFMLVVPLRGTAFDARAEVVPGNSLRGLFPLHSNSPGKHDDEARCARPPRHCASQHQQGARPYAAPALFPPC